MFYERKKNCRSFIRTVLSTSNKILVQIKLREKLFLGLRNSLFKNLGSNLKNKLIVLVQEILLEFHSDLEVVRNNEIKHLLCLKPLLRL